MKAFSETVLVQYPREGIWSLGFVTGTSFKDIRAASGVETVSVFIPTSPTPMTGFVINVARSEAIKVDISIDQALRFIITAGVLTPDSVGPDGVTKSQDKSAAKLLSAHEAAERAFETENKKRSDEGSEESSSA